MMLLKAELVKIVEEGFETEKLRILAQVEKGIESAKRSMVTKIESCFNDVNQTSAQTRMRLDFRNAIAQTIRTGEEIKGENGFPIEMALVDDSTGDVVEAGPDASADVEIVLLKGKAEGDDWTTEEFNANIVSEVEGKQPILAGNIALQLKRGLGLVENIKFRHHASKIKPSQFMLGARVVGDCRIKEAKTEPFTLKDFRSKYYVKHEIPSLCDEVSRLVCIRRGGKINKRLEENKIYTVEDFLIRLLINPQDLKSIVKSQAKKWEAIVNNAQACVSGKRMYFYMDPEQKTGIIFNILGQVHGIYLGSCYSRTSTLSAEQKEQLLRCACENWEEVKAFDDENSLQQHLSCLDTNMDLSGSQKPDAAGVGHENSGASEMVAESSSMQSNISCVSTSSRRKWLGESVAQEFGSFSSGGESDDIDKIYEAAMQLQYAWPCSPINFGDIGCTAVVEADNKADGGEAHVVSMSSAPKRWKKLLCISRLLRRKRVCVDVSPGGKKQKLG